MIHKFQQHYAYSPPKKYSGSILDGRDITSVQMKNAMFKFYITANVKVRAIRRFKELKALKKKINLNSNQKKYFIDKYYSPNLPIKFSLHLFKIANCSMDVSDGLVIDLNKLI